MSTPAASSTAATAAVRIGGPDGSSDAVEALTIMSCEERDNRQASIPVLLSVASGHLTPCHVRRRWLEGGRFFYEHDSSLTTSGAQSRHGPDAVEI